MNFLVIRDYIIQIGDFQIKWYAICIILGAIVAWRMSQFFAAKAGKKKDILDDLFLIAFPAGAIGARIWYVLSNLSEYSSLWEALDIRGGGLAIQGGVVAGVLVGYWYFKKKYPNEKFMFWFDIVVPNILIAQAIGRWGNFFNIEVFGMCVEKSKIWWVPEFIIKNMVDPSRHETICAVSSQVHHPMFLYEMLLNALGFVLITFVARTYWKKYRRNGDLGALYFLWYGTVRFILEPYRHPIFIMRLWGMNSSQLVSALFIVFGVGWFIGSRIYDKKFPPKEDVVVEKSEEESKNGEIAE